MYRSDLRKSLLGSAMMHALVILALVKFYESFLVVRTPLLMELTLIGQMSRGEGLGAKESKPGVEPGALPASDPGRGEFDTPSRKARDLGTDAKKAGDVSLAKEPVTETASGASDRDRYLESLRESAPIGIDPRKKDIAKGIKTTAGLGHMGVAGSPTGNASIEGQLAARGIKRKVFPEYPDWAKKQGVEGSVKYRITVLPNGMLKDDVQVDQTSGYREMDKQVYDALIQWEFEPLPDSIPQVEQSGVITFIFNFRQGVTTP
jgi:TonB family protein